MKIASFEKDGVASYGVVTDDGFIDLGARLGSDFPQLIDVLRADALDQIEIAVKNQEPDFLTDEVTFRIPIPTPEKIK